MGLGAGLQRKATSDTSSTRTKSLLYSGVIAMELCTTFKLVYSRPLWVIGINESHREADTNTERRARVGYVPSACFVSRHVREQCAQYRSVAHSVVRANTVILLSVFESLYVDICRDRQILLQCCCCSVVVHPNGVTRHTALLLLLLSRPRLLLCRCSTETIIFYVSPPYYVQQCQYEKLNVHGAETAARSTRVYDMTASRQRQTCRVSSAHRVTGTVD